MKKQIKITPKYLANHVKVEDVIKAHKYLYPRFKITSKEALANFLSAFEKVKNAAPVRQKNQGERLTVTVCGDYSSPKSIEEDDLFYSCATNAYSLSFRKWSEVSNIEIEEDTLLRLKPADFLAHFIWEITWYGSEEMMLEKGKEMKKSVLETIKKIKKEDKKKKK